MKCRSYLILCIINNITKNVTETLFLTFVELKPNAKNAEHLACVLAKLATVDFTPTSTCSALHTYSGLREQVQRIYSRTVSKYYSLYTPVATSKLNFVNFY